MTHNPRLRTHTPKREARRATQAYAYRSSTRLSSVAISLRDPATLGYKKMDATHDPPGTFPVLVADPSGGARRQAERRRNIRLERDEPDRRHRPVCRELDSKRPYQGRHNQH